MRNLTRRGLLVGTGAAALVGAGAYGVEAEVVPGRWWLAQHLQDQGPDGVVPDVAAGPLRSSTFASRARGQQVRWALALPPGAGAAARSTAPLPVAVVLHGKGHRAGTAFSRLLGWQHYLAQHVRAGGTPFALASIDGGDSYWHPRERGVDAGAMVLEELLPRLARLGLDTSRVAFWGWSMGGYGALQLARRHGVERTVAVAALSPALFRSYEDTTPGSFDSRRDFRRNTAFGHGDELAGLPVRIDCGRSDPFSPAVQEYVAELRRARRRASDDAPVAGGIEKGAHTAAYWRRMTPAQMRFLADAFAARS